MRGNHDRASHSLYFSGFEFGHDAVTLKGGCDNESPYLLLSLVGWSILQAPGALS
jgi:hypothetical protein